MDKDRVCICGTGDRVDIPHTKSCDIVNAFEERVTTNLSPNQTQIGGTHYKDKSIQPWEYMEAILTPSEFEGYLRGNVIKYISRYPEKAGLQDLQKAQHYLAKLIAFINQSIHN